MPKSVAFTVYGIPKAKQLGRPVPLLKCKKCTRQSSARPCRHCGSGEMDYLTTFISNDKDVASYENLAHMAAIAEMQKLGITRLEGALGVTIALYFPVAKTRAKKLAEGEWHCQKPDVDNVSKALLDAVKRSLFSDDCLIASLHVTKRWTHGMAQAVVEIEELA